MHLDLLDLSVHLVLRPIRSFYEKMKPICPSHFYHEHDAQSWRMRQLCSCQLTGWRRGLSRLILALLCGSLRLGNRRVELLRNLRALYIY